VIALQNQTFLLVTEAIFLQNCLRQNSAFGFPYVTEVMANIEVWEEGKPYVAFGYRNL